MISILSTWMVLNLALRYYITYLDSGAELFSYTNATFFFLSLMKEILDWFLVTIFEESHELISSTQI